MDVIFTLHKAGASKFLLFWVTFCKRNRKNLMFLAQKIFDPGTVRFRMSLAWGVEPLYAKNVSLLDPQLIVFCIYIQGLFSYQEASFETEKRSCDINLNEWN